MQPSPPGTSRTLHLAKWKLYTHQTITPHSSLPRILLKTTLYKRCQSVQVGPRNEGWMLEKWWWKEQEPWKPTGRGLAGRVVCRGVIPCCLLGSWAKRPVWSCGVGVSPLCLSSRLRHQVGWLRSQHWSEITALIHFPQPPRPEGKQSLSGNRFCVKAACRFWSYSWCVVENI